MISDRNDTEKTADFRLLENFKFRLATNNFVRGMETLKLCLPSKTGNLGVEKRLGIFYGRLNVREIDYNSKPN